MPKKDFTIQRRGRETYERTVVGRDGQIHVMQAGRGEDTVFRFSVKLYEL